MRDALIAAGNKQVIFKLMQGGNHWSYGAIYTDPDFWKWLFAQRRKGAAAHQTFSTTQVALTNPTKDSAPQAVRVVSIGTPDAGILCQYWRDIPGSRVRDLTGDSAYPHFPNEQVLLGQMEIPPNQPSDFGTVLSGWLRPPQSGDYTLFIASDDQGELWLSSDDKPEHLQRIARVPTWSLPREWTQYPQQQSQAIHLDSEKAILHRSTAQTWRRRQPPGGGVEVARWHDGRADPGHKIIGIDCGGCPRAEDCFDGSEGVAEFAGKLSFEV